MASQNNRITVSELDFDQIKTNLKTYLQGQSEFTDYNFEGSGLSVLLDVLSLNTHYNSLYKNLAVNEMFLDSAVKRNSVVSRARELGYMPYSASCSNAVVNVSVTNTTSFPTILNLPKHSTFTTNVNGMTYTFYTTETNSVVYNNGYFFNNISIKEGTPLSFKYVAADGMRYIIPNANADLSTLTVRIQDTAGSSNFVNYYKADTIVNITGADKVFFVKEIDNKLYEIQFGDDIIGKAIANGNVINIEYFVSSLSAPNGARQFTYTGESLAGGAIVVTTVDASSGGSDVESIDSIKYNAPKGWASQNRAVTPDDYKTLIYNNFPEAQSVSVWGGEDNTPPVYGKAFICIKPKSGDVISDTQKAYIASNILQSRKVVSITPEFVDPEYLRIGLNVTVYYNEQSTSRSAADIKTLVQQNILSYNDTDLQTFDSVFRFSKLGRIIDNSEPSIVNNISKIIIRRSITPKYNTSAEYNINLINPIYSEQVPEQAVSSTGFYIYGQPQIHYLQDDGYGNIQLYHKVTSGTETTVKIVDPTIGTVNYTTGVINVKNLNIVSIVGTRLDLIIKPESSDVVSAYTQIAEIDTDNLVINVISDKTSSGDLGGGLNYVFTSTAK